MVSVDVKHHIYFTYLLAYLPAYLFPYLLTYLHTYVRTYLPAYLPTYLFCMMRGCPDYGSVPEVLHEVDLDAYDNVECQRTFQTSTLYDINSYLTEGVMCAANGTTGGQDSCRVSLNLKLV